MTGEAGSINETFSVLTASLPCHILRYDRMRLKSRRVPTRDNGVSDTNAISVLGISRATFFRLLRSGVFPQPTPISGTKRRWWTPADLQLAKDALREHRKGAA
jgi:predicted DNA-binding transcriptional regulator AlpA